MTYRGPGISMHLAIILFVWKYDKMMWI